MTATLKIISPVDGSVYAERLLADDKEVLLTLMRARAAQLKWREVPIAGRVQDRHGVHRRHGRRQGARGGAA